MKVGKISGINILIFFLGTELFAFEFININQIGQIPPSYPTSHYTTYSPEVQRFIEQFQEENSKFIDVLVEPNLQLPYDAIFVREDGRVEIQGGATTGTEIGFWLVYLTNIAKGDIKVSNISPEDALSRLKTALENVRGFQLDPDKNWNGLLYKYNFKTGAIDRMACIYDNGNFSASLGVVIGAFVEEQDEPIKREIVSLAKDILEAQRSGWQALYDRRTGLLWGNYKKDHRLDILGSEGRLGAIMAIVVGDVPESVFRKLKVYTGSYTLSDEKVVEFLAPYEGAFQLYFPLIFIPEDEWSEEFEKSHNNYAAVQIDYANKTDLPGFRSACASPYNPYTYSYVPGIGIPGTSFSNISRDDIGATHATAFLNLIAPEKCVKIFQEMGKFTQGRIWGPYGMFDSVGKNGEVSRVYISLDHLAMLISMAGKVNQKYFVRFLEEMGKLELIKSLYGEIDLGILEKVELPQVKEFPVPSPLQEVPPVGRFTLIDFEEGRFSKYVSGLGKFDGPGKNDYIYEDVWGGVLEINYRTEEYNGVWINLIGLGKLQNYKKIILDLKSSTGMDALKIEIKGNKGGWMHYYLRNIGKGWKTFEIPINKFEVASWEKRFRTDEIPTQLIITIDGSQLRPGQRSGTLYVDNIRME